MGGRVQETTVDVYAAAGAPGGVVRDVRAPIEGHRHDLVGIDCQPAAAAGAGIAREGRAVDGQAATPDSWAGS